MVVYCYEVNEERSSTHKNWNEECTCHHLLDPTFAYQIYYNLINYQYHYYNLCAYNYS